MRWQWFAALAAAMSALDFILMGLDKRRAKKGAWRVRESTLFLVAALGGAPGGWLGMYFFHHKTKHWYFKWGMPLLILLYILVAAYFIQM